MAKEKVRIDTTGKDSALTQNPFAALQGLASAMPPAAAPVAEPPERAHEPTFRIERTRKGGWPLRVENRPGGKVVTVLDHLSGDTEALLKLLKKQCGAGGVAREDSIELQGDHRARIEAWISKR